MKDFIRSYLPHLFDPTSLLGSLVYAVLILGLAIFAARLVRISLKRATKLFPDTAEAIFATQFLQAIVFLVAIILYAHLIPALHSLGTALLTGASVASIIVGLASQSSLGNVISGFSIFLFHRFHVGDRLQMNTPKGLATGTIEALTLGYTTLRTYENEEILVPNTVMANAIIIRLSPIEHKE